MAEWHCRYNGTSCNPAWLTIGKAAGCAPGVVAAVYDAVCEHGNTRSPRGAVGDFDVESYAAFSGFEEPIVLAILEQLLKRKLIVDGELADAARLYPVKHDRTAAERKRRQRDREKAGKNQPEVTESHAVTTPAEPGHAVTSHVTPLERESEAISLCSKASAASSSCSVVDFESKSTSTSESTRALALSAAQVMQKLEAEGAAGNLAHRTWHAGKVNAWAARGVTAAQLEAALAIGRAKRAAARSPQPLNIGFLDTILGDVMAMPEASKPVAARNSGNSPPKREDQLQQAVAFAKHLLSLGSVDQVECDRMIADAKAKHGREVAA